MMALPNLKIADCTIDYLDAVTNPFSYNRELPCYPDNTIVPSYKLKTYVRGNFTGGAGAAYVLFNPFQAIFNNQTAVGSFANYPILSTNDLYVGSGITYAVAGGAITTTGVVGANAQSPLETSANLQYRLVAAGLEVEYHGSNFRNQGTIYQIRAYNGSNIASGTSASDVMQSDYTRRQAVVKKRKYYVYYTPRNSYFTSYHGRADLDPATAALGYHFDMGILINGLDTETPQDFIYEAVAFFEVTGPGVPLSPSHSDPTGLGCALSALPTRAPDQNPSEVTKGVLQMTYDALSNNVSGLMNTKVYPAMANYAANKITGIIANAATRVLT
jgi:hypothetical protein